MGSSARGDRRLQQRLADEVIGQQSGPEFLPDGGGGFAAEDAEAHGELDIAEFEFDIPT